MADQRLRQLQIQATLEGTPKARAAHLWERMRVVELPPGPCLRCRGTGELATPLDPTFQVPVPCPTCEGTGQDPLHWVELAAYLGDEAARSVSDAGPCPAWMDPMDGWEGYDALGPRRWIRGLARWGQVVCVRAAVAAARVALSKWCPCPGRPSGFFAPHNDACTHCSCGYSWASHARDDNPRKVRARRALEAAEAWLLCPCKEHRAWCDELLNTFEGNPGPWFGMLYALVHWRDGTNGAALASAVQSVERSARLTDEPAARKVVREELIPWALALGDPVRERVEARSR